jgi:two-component system, NarL family, nitrate/nitrite response regulator NarL
VRERLFVVVSFAACAELLVGALAAHGRFEIVGAETDGEAAVSAIARLDRAPNLVLVDASVRSGVLLARTLHADVREIRVAVVGLDEDPAQVLAWARAGATGLVARSASVDELLRTLEGVMQGEAPCSPAISGALLRGIGDSAESDAGKNHRNALTEREHEVALHVAAGWTNKEIAAHLHIETGTVKTHVHSVIHKLGVSRRAQVASGLRLDDLWATPPPALDAMSVEHADGSRPR